MWQGQDSNLCRQCRRFYRSHRRLLAGPVPSPLVSIIACDVRKRPADSFRVPRRAFPFRPVPRGLASGGGKSEGNLGCHLTESTPTSSPRSLGRMPSTAIAALMLVTRQVLVAGVEVGRLPDGSTSRAAAGRRPGWPRSAPASRTPAMSRPRPGTRPGAGHALGDPTRGGWGGGSSEADGDEE